MAFTKEQSQFIKNFKQEDPAALAAFKKQYCLDQVIAKAKNELEQLHWLANWTYEQLPRFGRPTWTTEQTPEILQKAKEGHTFYCAHFALVMVSAALALGWEARVVSQRRADYPDRVSNHNVVEVWWRQGRKWIMIDPTHKLHITDSQGKPLHCYEIGEEWFLRQGKNLVFVVDRETRQLSVKDLPVRQTFFEGYGWMEISARMLNGYAHLAYIPTNRFLEKHEGKSIEHWDDWDQLVLINALATKYIPKAHELPPYYRIEET